MFKKEAKDTEANTEPVMNEEDIIDDIIYIVNPNDENEVEEVYEKVLKHSKEILPKDAYVSDKTKWNDGQAPPMCLIDTDVKHHIYDEKSKKKVRCVCNDRADY
jgi:hypothetical protein